MHKPRFFSWEFLGDRVDSPYEAIIILSKESRRLNSVPVELQPDNPEKKTSQAMSRLLGDELTFEYESKNKKKKR